MPETLIKAGQEQAKYYPYSGIFHLTRNSFWTAGQDSYTQPPAQDPDLFKQLVNIEPVTQGILQHRRGYSLFNSSFSPVSPFIRSYAFRSDSRGLRQYVWMFRGVVDVTDEAGNIVANPLFTPTINSPFPPRMVLSRDYGYFTDGLVVDSKKWDGTLNTLNLTNWGISGASVAVSTLGPTAPGTATGNTLGGAATPWANPTNIQVADGVFATCNTVGSGFSDNLTGTNYGFAAAGGIVGIQVDITYTGTNTFNILGSLVSLTKNGVAGAGTYKSFLPVPGSNTQVSFGGPTDLWGTTWLPSDINASTFGAFMQYSQHAGAAVTMSVDYMQITVYTQPGAITVGAPGAGLINLFSGRTYFQAFQSSTSGHTGPLSAASSSTGPLTNKSVPLSNIKVSNDPQVTSVLILATADGNDQTTLYLVATLPNGTTTYTDNTPDTVLQTQALYLNTDINGNIHGIANNNPPPAGLNFPTKHKGRLYGAVGRALYFSKNLDDVTTANGLITSKWEEAWPATYQFDISETAETIQGLLSDGETLWIGTERGIRRLVGDSPANFQKPEIQFNEAGLLNQDVWKIVFYEGQPVGTMWLTPDFRVMVSDFNTYQDVGRPIQDVLSRINLNAQVPPHAAFVSSAAFDLYMLYLPVDSDISPSTICVYDLRMKKWHIWQPFDQVTTALFNINATGVPQWLFATQQGNIYFWDPATQLDRNGVNGAFAQFATIQTSWLNFGDETLKKALNQHILYTSDINMTFTLEGAITQAQLVAGSPPLLVSNQAISTGPLGGYLYVPLAGVATRHNWYRFTWRSNNVGPVLLGAYNTETIPIVRI